MRTRASIPLPEVLEFLQVLWRLVHGVEQVSKRMSREWGVTGPQRFVLRVVGLAPGLSAGDLAATLHVHPSTLTGILRRLEEEGLIARSADAADRRRAVLHLTERGRRKNAGRVGTVEACATKALRGVSGRDRQCAKRVLEQLAEELTNGLDC
jgi:DNA-binding MarR family transcriptional regulator